MVKVHLYSQDTYHGKANLFLLSIEYLEKINIFRHFSHHLLSQFSFLSLLISNMRMHGLVCYTSNSLTALTTQPVPLMSLIYLISLASHRDVWTEVCITVLFTQAGDLLG